MNPTFVGLIQAATCFDPQENKIEWQEPDKSILRDWLIDNGINPEKEFFNYLPNVRRDDTRIFCAFWWNNEFPMGMIENRIPKEIFYLLEGKSSSKFEQGITENNRARFYRTVEEAYWDLFLKQKKGL